MATFLVLKQPVTILVTDFTNPDKLEWSLQYIFTDDLYH